MRVTIKDIAKKAGVSHTTGSRALNGHPSISKKKASEIKRLPDEMDYLPSAAARGLKTNRSHALGAIVSRIDDPYFGEILQGIEEILQNTGYSLFVASSHNDPLREDNIPFSSYTRPILTTFDQPKHQIGAEAARLILSLLPVQPGPNSESEPVNLLKQGRLLVRESTAPPKLVEDF